MKIKNLLICASVSVLAGMITVSEAKTNTKGIYGGKITPAGGCTATFTMDKELTNCTPNSSISYHNGNYTMNLPQDAGTGTCVLALKDQNGEMAKCVFFWNIEDESSTMTIGFNHLASLTSKYWCSPGMGFHGDAYITDLKPTPPKAK